MTPLPSSTSPTPPAIQTREQLESLLENIVYLQGEYDELRHRQENEIAAVRLRYRAPLAEMENFLQLETSWAEAWARGHLEALGPDHSLRCAHASLGFHAMPPRVERASRRWTWSRIALTLADLPWGKRYLRLPPPEVDKDAVLADLADLSHDDLRAAGIKIVQGDRFLITTHLETETACVSEPAWQEAA